MVLYRRVVRTVDKLNPLQMRADIKPPAVLESVNQQTLTGMLDQLAYFVAYSAELFNDLLKESNKTAERIAHLAARTDALLSYVQPLEEMVSNANPYSFLDNNRVGFRSQHRMAHGHFTSESIPSSIKDVYTRECVPPPNLSIMDPFREDGKSCMKEYSNPTFFIDEWIADQTRQAEEQKKERARRRAEREAAGGGKNKQNKAVKKVQLNRRKYDPMGFGLQKGAAGGSSTAVTGAGATPGGPTNAPANTLAGTVRGPMQPESTVSPRITEEPAPPQAILSQPPPSALSFSQQIQPSAAPYLTGAAAAAAAANQPARSPSPRPGGAAQPSVSPLGTMRNQQAQPAAPPRAPPSPRPHHAPQQQQYQASSDDTAGYESAPPPPPPARTKLQSVYEAPKASPYAPYAASTYAAPAPQAAFPPPPPGPAPSLSPRPGAGPSSPRPYGAPPAAPDHSAPSGGGGPPPPPPPKAPAPPPKAPPPAPRAPQGPAPSQPVNVRSNLMQQIQQGMKLRSVDEGGAPATTAGSKPARAPAPPPKGESKGDIFNVEQILRRRAAIADSDSEDDGDDDEWE